MSLISQRGQSYTDKGRGAGGAQRPIYMLINLKERLRANNGAETKSKMASP